MGKKWRSGICLEKLSSVRLPKLSSPSFAFFAQSPSFGYDHCKSGGFVKAIIIIILKSWNSISTVPLYLPLSFVFTTSYQTHLSSSFPTLSSSLESPKHEERESEKRKREGLFLFSLSLSSIFLLKIVIISRIQTSLSDVFFSYIFIITRIPQACITLFLLLPLSLEIKFSFNYQQHQSLYAQTHFHTYLHAYFSQDLFSNFFVFLFLYIWLSASSNSSFVCVHCMRAPSYSYIFIGLLSNFGHTFMFQIYWCPCILLSRTSVSPAVENFFPAQSFRILHFKNSELICVARLGKFVKICG